MSIMKCSNKSSCQWSSIDGRRFLYIEAHVLFLSFILCIPVHAPFAKGKIPDRSYSEGRGGGKESIRNESESILPTLHNNALIHTHRWIYIVMMYQCSSVWCMDAGLASSILARAVTMHHGENGHLKHYAVLEGLKACFTQIAMDILYRVSM